MNDASQVTVGPQLESRSKPLVVQAPAPTDWLIEARLLAGVRPVTSGTHLMRGLRREGHFYEKIPHVFDGLLVDLH